MWRRLFENFVLKATDWLFKTTQIERYLIGGSLTVICVVFGGPKLVEILFKLASTGLPGEYQNTVDSVDAMKPWILGICIAIIVLALSMIIMRFIDDRKANAKNRLLVIEGRGLRDDDGSPLIDAIPKSIIGQRIDILLDLRNRTDGKVIEPERAISEIEATHRSINQHRASLNRSDLTVFYGGLTSVPYTFLTGLLLDDEAAVVTYDWERKEESWRTLDDVDDGLNFKVTRIGALDEIDDVVVALSYSYPINDSDLATTFSIPVVRMTLDGMSSDSHWSQLKQNRLAQQFFELIKELSSLGVKQIHLVMAAPNSVVFNFGRRYDKRNLPKLIVYQYERDHEPAYPWGIQMPVSGLAKPKVMLSS